MTEAEQAGRRALAAATEVEKIGFVDFTTNLVRGVYEVIVEASMDQLKAYADFVNSVAKTLKEFQDETVGKDETERTETADNYIREVLDLDINEDPSEGDTITFDALKHEALKEHFSGTTISVQEGEETVEKTIEDYITVNEATNEGSIPLGDLRTFVIEKLKKNAQESYNLMVTILKIGMQKVVVTNGQIRTKLTFHVDATDTYSKTSMDYHRKSKTWGIRGRLSGRYGGIGGAIGRITFGKFIGGGISGGYGSSKLSVSVVNEKSTAATNVTVDVIGEVNIHFRTETFPTIEG